MVSRQLPIYFPKLHKVCATRLETPIWYKTAIIKPRLFNLISSPRFRSRQRKQGEHE